MTSDRKIKANRANARASTGPKTAHGRARAARNALRHALSLPVCSNPALSEEVETLAREIAGPGANAETQDLARQVAEAQIDLRRVRYARHKLLSDALADPHYDNWREKMAVLRSLLRKNAPDLPVENLVAFLNSTPQGPHKFATILSQEAKQLLAMDRYERRALSRRKSAIRAFDETRDGRLIAIIECTTYSCMTGRTKPKCSIFSMHGRVLPKIWERSNICAPHVFPDNTLSMSFLSKLSAGSAHDLWSALPSLAQRCDPLRVPIDGDQRFEDDGNSSSHATRLACMQSAGNPSGEPAGYLITNSSDFGFS